MLYEPPKTKKYILIGVAAIVLVVLVIVIFQKTRQKIAEPLLPAGVQKTSEQTEEEIRKALNEENVPAQNDSSVQQEKTQLQEEILSTVNKSNPSAEVLPKKEQSQTAQEILNAMGAANPKKK